MTKLFLLSLFILPQSFAGSFSALWWNVGGGNFWAGPNQAYWTPCYADSALRHTGSPSGERGDRTPMVREEQALQAMALRSDSPDVMMFGEYFPGFFSPEALQELKKSYPYSFEFPYNSLGRNLEIFVLSKKEPVATSYTPESLHWAKSQTDEPKSPNRNAVYLRSYQRLSFKIDSHTINIVPLHAAEPWAIMEEQLGGNTPYQHLRGLLETGLSLLFSKTNPSAIQGLYFQKELKQEMNEQSADSSWLVMGDFNLPSRVLGIMPVAFKRFKGSLTEIEPPNSPAVTFPSIQCGMYQKQPHLKIDHALTSGQGFTSSEEILGSTGSDHFPIRVKLQFAD